MTVIDVVEPPATTPTLLPRQYGLASVLLLLSESPTHGYRLATQLRELGAGGTDLATHYRSLREMERAGLVRSRWERSEVGPARRTYYLTGAGTDRLEEFSASLQAASETLGTFLARYSRPSVPAGGAA